MNRDYSDEAMVLEEDVLGEKCRVIVCRTGKVTWTARGSWKNQSVEATGRSFESARSHWKRVARMKADWP
jgi:hypothetical protein